jgi:outer membrane receptor for ferric coprogen and ferric-rhodotorulic acid
LKKDINIPVVKDVYVAVVFEYNDIYKTYDWNAYIINDKKVDLDVVLIVTSGYSKDKTTSIFRKKLDKLPAKSYAKIELMQEELFALNNQFKVTFFEGNNMFDKTYLFRKNTINKNALQPIPLMEARGVLVK